MTKDYLLINSGADGKKKQFPWYVSVLERRSKDYSIFNSESRDFAEFSYGLINLLRGLAKPPVRLEFKGEILPNNKKLIEEIVEFYNSKKS